MLAMTTGAELLTLQQFSDFLGMDRKTASRMVRQPGFYPLVDIGPSMHPRIDMKLFRRWLKSRSQQPK